MQREIITVILFILFSHLHVNADIYQYEDKDGTVIMTDRPENLPEKSRLLMSDATTTTNNGTSKNIVRQIDTLSQEQESCSQLEENLGACRRNLQGNAIEKKPEGVSEDEFIVFVHELCGNPLLQSKLTEQEKTKVRELSPGSVKPDTENMV